MARVTGTLNEDRYTFMIILNQAEFFLELEMFQIKFVKKIKTRILCSITFFFFENRAVYEIMGENFVQPDRPTRRQYDTAHALCVVDN